MARALPGALRDRGAARLDPAWAAALTSWLVARVAVGLGFLVAHGAAGELTPGSEPLPLVQGLVAWDGAFYRDIATAGYDGLREEALRFFPLFPVLGRALAVVLPGGAAVGLVVVANASALVAGVLLHRLVRCDGGTQQQAATATWLVAVLPASAVLVLAYTEALFLALTVGALLAVRRGRWEVVAVLAALAGACRPSGVALALPLAIEAARGLVSAPWGERATRLAAVVAAPLGTLAYLAWVGARFGDPLAPMRIQGAGDLRGGWVDPLSRIAAAVADAPEEGLLGEALHLPWIALFVALAVVGRRLVPVSYTAYTAVLLVLAVSAESLGSFERYGIAAFPLAVVAARLLGDPAVRTAVLVCSGAGLAAFTSLVLLGVFVP